MDQEDSLENEDESELQAVSSIMQVPEEAACSIWGYLGYPYSVQRPPGLYSMVFRGL